MGSHRGVPATAPAASTLLWLADAGGLPEALLAGAAARLNAAERARHARFVRAARRRQFVAGRVMLRFALGSLLGVPAAAIELIERPGNAPALAFPLRPDLSLSISHSGDWVACAASTTGAIGLDIEQVDPARDILALAAQAFGDAEAAQFAALEGEAGVDAFYRMWCRHEAHIKLGATGGHDHFFARPGLSIVLSSARPLARVPEITTVSLAALLAAPAW